MVFEIVVHNPAENWDNDHPESSLALGQWLDQSPDWMPDWEEVGIRLVPEDGDPWQEDFWAPLDILEPMCAEAAKRLSEQQMALLRSVGDDQPGWLLFEPAGDQVHLAVLVDLVSPNGGWWPILDPPGWSVPENTPEQLYNYVRAERDRLLRPFDRPAAQHAHLRGRKVPLNALVAALSHAAATAHAVLEQRK